MPLVNRDTETLHFDNNAVAARPHGSPKYAHLAELAYNGFDRMIMQSDLRDIYQGLHGIRFGNTTTSTVIPCQFDLQLSDNNTSRPCFATVASTKYGGGRQTCSP